MLLLNSIDYCSDTWCHVWTSEKSRTQWTRHKITHRTWRSDEQSRLYRAELSSETVSSSISDEENITGFLLWSNTSNPFELKLAWLLRVSQYSNPLKQSYLQIKSSTTDQK